MAKTFKNFADLCKALDSDEKIQEQVQEQIAEISAARGKKRGLRNTTLDKMADDLMQMVMDNLNEYYMSYSPIVYIRTYNLVDMFVTPKIDYKKKTIVIYFSEKAWHDSIDGSHESFVPLLLDRGWSVGGYNTPRSRFLYFEGSNFITNAIEAFNRKYADKGAIARFITE